MDRVFLWKLSVDGVEQDIEFTVYAEADDPSIGFTGGLRIENVRFAYTGADVPDRVVEQHESELIAVAEETLSLEAHEAEGQKYNETEQAARDGEWRPRRGL
jgi:hypothetical protein